MAAALAVEASSFRVLAGRRHLYRGEGRVGLAQPGFAQPELQLGERVGERLAQDGSHVPAEDGRRRRDVDALRSGGGVRVLPRQPAAEQDVHRDVLLPEAEPLADQPRRRGEGRLEGEAAAGGRRPQQTAHRARLEQAERPAQIAIDRLDGRQVAGQDDGEGGAREGAQVTLGGRKVGVRCEPRRREPDQPVFPRVKIVGAAGDAIDPVRADHQIGLDRIEAAGRRVTVLGQDGVGRPALQQGAQKLAERRQGDLPLGDPPPSAGASGATAGATRAGASRTGSAGPPPITQATSRRLFPAPTARAMPWRTAGCCSSAASISPSSMR